MSPDCLCQREISSWLSYEYVSSLSPQLINTLGDKKVMRFKQCQLSDMNKMRNIFLKIFNDFFSNQYKNLNTKMICYRQVSNLSWKLKKVTSLFTVHDSL